MGILNGAILKCENGSLTGPEVHKIMVGLKIKLTERLNDEFYGSKVMSALKYLQATEKQQLLREAIDWFMKKL